MADVKCRICKKKIPKEMAYKVEHITSGGNKQNHYYCSREEFEEVEREKDFYKKCQSVTDRIMGQPITNNVRNKKLSELHKKGPRLVLIIVLLKILLLLLKRVKEFNFILSVKLLTNEYNKIAYMFGAVEKEINKYKGKKIKENKKVEVNEIDEYKGQRVKKQNDKPTLMDLIKRGNLNGK